MEIPARLSESFKALDVPLEVTWPDGSRAAVLFVVEEEAETRKFSIHRLANYCLLLAEEMRTERVVPVVLFVRRGRFDTRLRLGTGSTIYLDSTTSTAICQRWMPTSFSVATTW